MEKPRLPISDKNMIRILVVLCVAFALIGGYFHAQHKTLQRRYDFLYDKYHRLLDEYEESLAASESGNLQQNADSITQKR